MYVCSYVSMHACMCVCMRARVHVYKQLASMHVSSQFHRRPPHIVVSHVYIPAEGKRKSAASSHSFHTVPTEDTASDLFVHM